jgi:hypothetical protein
MLNLSVRVPRPWEAIQEDDNRKAAMEVRRLALEERKAMMELVADKNRTMMMDPSTMDAFTEEWWDMRREEIMERRRQERLQREGGGASLGGGVAGLGDDCAGLGADGGGDGNTFIA